MKKFRKVIICLLIVAMLGILSGCGQLEQKLENAELRANTETVLDALLADDMQKAYGLFEGSITQAEFAPIFDQMQAFLDGEDSYTLELQSISANSTLSQGQRVDAVYAVYLMTVKGERIALSVGTDGRADLTRFYLTPYEKTDLYYTGTFQNMAGANAAQWILLALNLLIAGFAVFALVDCFRSKPKKYGWWILFLLLGFVSFAVTVSSTGIRLHFNLGWIRAYTALIRYGSGAVTLRLMLPVGAISYFITRRNGKKLPVTDFEELAAAEGEPSEDVQN